MSQQKSNRLPSSEPNGTEQGEKGIIKPECSMLIVAVAFSLKFFTHCIALTDLVAKGGISMCAVRTGVEKCPSPFI